MTSVRRSARHLRGQGGMTLIEVLVAVVVMALMVSTLSSLVGAAVRSKLITATRSADTETARQTLEWMSERVRNAGLNVRPSAQAQVRCKDMVVAQESSLRPTATSLYVSGEILNSNTTAGDEVITLGYSLQNGVVMEARSSCAGSWSPVTSKVSNPRVTVTALNFQYFNRTGDPVTNLTDEAAIRSIRVIRVSLAVQAVEGRSGVQTQTFSRMIMLRNPQPDRHDWPVSGVTETNP